MGTLTVRLKPENREKLRSMAKEVGVTQNRLINLLIENAVLTPVALTRAVALVEKQQKGRHA